MNLNDFFKNNKIHEVDENGNPVRKQAPEIDPTKLIKELILPVFLILAIYVFFTTATFTVNEMEQAVVTRFGEITRVIVEEKTPEIVSVINAKYPDVKIDEGKGLFIKVPFIDFVEKYTSQLLTYNTKASEVTTSDKKKIVLNNNAQWKITNPVLFKVKLASEQKANSRLDDIIFSKLNEKIGLTEGSTLISDKEYVYNMALEIKNETNEEMKDFGMEVVDVRIAKTELPQENNENIFNRMRTERQKIANKFRAEGDEQYKIITAKAEKEATILRAEAYATAEQIKGEGDATALEIYAESYNKDAEFYQFYQTLITYKKTIGKNTKLVISPDSEFAKYLYGAFAEEVTE